MDGPGLGFQNGVLVTGVVSGGFPLGTHKGGMSYEPTKKVRGQRRGPPPDRSSCPGKKAPTGHKGMKGWSTQDWDTGLSSKSQGAYLKSGFPKHGL